jgi:hypothetical protein
MGPPSLLQVDGFGGIDDDRKVTPVREFPRLQ